MNFDSERVSKLFGIFLLFLSFYFFIAFISYLFTWKNDHDIVFRFSWDMFLKDFPVDNWLGRLGAFLSDSIIYWGFGISSFGIVYLLYKYGLALVRRVPLSYLALTLQRTVILMVTTSIVASFFFQKLEFPWGGVFGQSVSEYIQNFLGTIGTLALMLFALVATFVWSNNPNLEELSWQRLWDETKQAWHDLLTGNFGKRRPVYAPPPPVSRMKAEIPTPAEEVGQINKSTAAESAESQLSLDLSQRSSLFAPEVSLPKREVLKPGGDGCMRRTGYGWGSRAMPGFWRG